VKGAKMKKENKTLLYLFCILLIILLWWIFSLADDSTHSSPIYDSPYGGEKISRIDERGFIYDDAYLKIQKE
jgi:hypothetical protein